MPEVVVKKGESVDRALKRLKNKMESEGVMDEMRRLRAFETPLQRTRRKAKAAFKRGRIKFRLNLRTDRPDRGEGSERELPEGPGRA